MAGTDIKQLLPYDEYQAIVGANAPSGANVFATMNDLSGIGGETLAQTLVIGNTTNDGQTIDALNGAGTLNLREGTDNYVFLGNATSNVKLRDSSAFINAGVFLTDPVVGGIELTQSFSQLTLTKGDFTKVGLFGLKYNDAVAGTTLDLPSYPGIFSSQNGTINVGVVNSVINGGDTVIAKTDNTDYSYQNGYNTGTAGELIVQHTPSATDRLQTHQDADGIIALLSDIPAGGGGLSSVLTAGDTGTLGQNINLIGGVLNLQNSGTTPGGPSCDVGGVTITPGATATTITTYACRPSLQQDLILTVHGFGSSVKIASPTVGGNGTVILTGNGEYTLIGDLSGTNRSATFQDASGTVAYLTDITGTNSGTNTGDQTSIVGITGTKAQFNTACTDGDFAYATGQTYTPSNVTTDRTYDANSTTLDELADVVGTLIADLKTSGIIL